MHFGLTLLGSFELAVLVKILLAALAGGIIGLERERHGRSAGLRTHLLVCAGACLMMLVSEAFFLKYGDQLATGVVRLDPGRVAAQIITGIGFLGAGVIIKEGLVVRGLTTAACLWMVSGIGMAFGMGMYTIGLIGTLVALFSLIILKRLEPHLTKDRYLHLDVTAETQSDIFPQLEKIITDCHLKITNIETDWDIKQKIMVYRLVITRQKSRVGRDLSNKVAEIESVTRVHFK